MLWAMKENSRADMHVHSTASELSKLGIQRALGLPECATPPEEVYELAKRRGMDFVTITDHDTIDGALAIADLPDVVHLRGADRRLRRRAPGGARPLLRHHARRPRVAPGPHRRRRDVRRVPPRARDRLRAGPPVLRGRGAADARATGAAWRSCSRSGRPATARAQGAQPAGGVYIETHGGTGDRRLRRSRRSRHRAHVHRDAARRRRPRSSSPTAGGRAERPRRTGQRRQVGARGDGAGHPRARRRGRRGGRPDPRPCCRWSSA